MILMVSVQNLEEAMEALRGGADIVDVKNLQEALVGSAHPTVVGQVRQAVPDDIHASVTLGVVPNQVGTVAMAAYAAGALNATSVKVGFMKTEYDLAVEILLACREALDGTETKLIGSLFADNPLYDGLDPHQMMRLARDGKCDGFPDRHPDEGWQKPLRLHLGVGPAPDDLRGQGARHEHRPLRPPQNRRPRRAGPD